MLIHGADIVLSFLGQTSHLILINNIFIISVTLTTKKKKQLRHRQVMQLPKKARRGASFPLGREVPSSALQDLNEESDLYLIFFPLPPGQGSWNSLWAHLGS